MTVLTGAFTGTNTSASVELTGDFNIALWGTWTSGTAFLERSFDNGVTWIQVTQTDGTAMSWTAPATTYFSEPEDGVVYRIRTSGPASGTLNWRLSQ